MDGLRGAAVLLVVLWHVPSLPAAYNDIPPTWLIDINAGLAPYRIPMLLVLSGLLLPRSLSKGLPRYYWGKVRGIVWPLVLWTFITTWVMRDMETMRTVDAWLGGLHHLWYLAVLMLAYLVGPVSRYVPAWVLPLPMIAASSFVDDLTWAQFLWHGAFFFVGAAVAENGAQWWVKRRWPVPVACAALAVVWGAWVTLSESTTGREYTLVDFVASLIGVAALVWLASRAPRMRWLEYVGQRSIVVYLVHFPVIGFVWIWMLENGHHDWNIMPPIFLLTALAVSVALLPLARSPLFLMPNVAAWIPRGRRKGERQQERATAARRAPEAASTVSAENDAEDDVEDATRTQA